MKIILKQILKYYLKYITKLVLIIHRPTVIAIAGSINKPFARDEIMRALKEKKINARANPKSFNTDIGLPLAILGLKSGYNEYRNWWPAILGAPLKIFNKSFPKYLVLELGTSDPGDMKYLLTIVKPKVVVITDITQRYLESFSDMEELVKEYKYLASKLERVDMLILNNDNQRIRALKDVTRAKTVSFGIREKADFYASDIIKKNATQKFRYTRKGEPGKIITQKRFGTHHVYSFLIAEIIKNYAAK